MTRLLTIDNFSALLIDMILHRFWLYDATSLFLLRDAAILLAPSLLSPGVCPSVCSSVTFAYCTQTAEDIVKLLPRLGSPIILVFF